MVVYQHYIRVCNICFEERMIMSRIEIIKRSHSFQVKTNYRGLANMIAKFGERFEEREWKKVKGQPATFQLIKQYSVVNDTNNHFVFHINAFKDFLGFLSWNGIGESLYTIETMPMHRPEKIDINIVSPYKPMEEQVPLIKYLGEPGKTKILTLQTGKGKALAKEEPVLTPNGWVDIGELKVNDEVVTPKGKAVKIKAIHRQGVNKTVKLQLEDGRISRCDLNHLWNVSIRGLWKTINTIELVKFLEDGFDVSLPLIDEPSGAVRESLLDDVEDLTGSRDVLESLSFDYPFKGSKELQSIYHELGYISDIRNEGDFVKITAIRPESGLVRIASVTGAEDAETVCIELDDEEHLFITRDYIVTHNTYCFLQGFAGIKDRCALILPAKYIQRWVDDLTGDGQVVDLTEDDLWVVKGAADFGRLISKAKNGQLHAKMIIFSSTTFQLYLKAFREDHNTALKEYGCEPIKLMKLLKVGVLGRDEVHELFHFNFLVDLSINVPKTISLSATVDFDNKMTNKMCALMFPKSEQINNGEWDKYIKAVGLYWKLEKPKLIRYTLNGAYNHGQFEASIIKNKRVLENYLDMIQDMVESVYSRFDNGEKVIVFAYTVQMCTLISKRLEEVYQDDKEISVNRYVGEDEYGDLMEGDIIVSTLKSAGTAVDIKSLRAVIMTTAIYSTQSNVQALGRLRKLRNKPHVSPEFYYLICKDIDKHIDYHKAKCKQFEGKVLSHETKNTQYLV